MDLRTLRNRLVDICGIVGVYILYILIHYLSAHLYVYYCVHASWLGIVTSAFYVSSPQCRILRWAFNFTSMRIELMWGAIGTWIVCRCLGSNG
jgi:hypothetical protein